jgi:hypothetical protein
MAHNEAAWGRDLTGGVQGARTPYPAPLRNGEGSFPSMVTGESPFPRGAYAPMVSLIQGHHKGAHHRGAGQGRS